ncbi:CsbD family protein [Paraburkholderia heleia]|uniref:CsbD family protein n=1 Tax=Paraburkholderia heleia TaxID=634127 RepID=UPI0005A5D079|nr:CsbD family protein [Paraburkholderia heleia]
MNKDQVKGTAEKMKGKVNEAVGRATGNPARELKGDVQQEAGQTRKDVGDMKEAAKDMAKDVAKDVKRHH